mgnify:CR=1 FL=1
MVPVTLLENSVAENPARAFRFNLTAPINTALAQASAMVSIAVTCGRVVAGTPACLLRDAGGGREGAGTAAFVGRYCWAGRYGPSAAQHGDSELRLSNATGDATATAGRRLHGHERRRLRLCGGRWSQRYQKSGWWWTSPTTRTAEEAGAASTWTCCATASSSPTIGVGGHTE